MTQYLNTERVAISIHAPRTGSDTHPNVYWLRPPAISIHAPRTGSDAVRLSYPRRTGYFNPRSPHGERRSSLPSKRWEA